MELKDIMLNRRSIRKFKKDKVSKEDIDTLLHYAMSAPSACNKQPWEFYVVTNEEMLLELKNASRFSRYNSPLNIIVCGSLKRSLPLQLAEYWIQDCSASIENILLGVTSLGLGAVWCGLHPQKNAAKKVREILGLDEKIVPLGLIHIGYPDETVAPRDQYNEKYVHFYE
ncbi:MAG: nitroreductase family protein [Bacilli bacterium]|nr:nitroreductase family protein [Bacilli bacterium]